MTIGETLNIACSSFIREHDKAFPENRDVLEMMSQEAIATLDGLPSAWMFYVGCALILQAIWEVDTFKERN